VKFDNHEVGLLEGYEYSLCYTTNSRIRVRLLTCGPKWNGLKTLMHDEIRGLALGIWHLAPSQLSSLPVARGGDVWVRGISLEPYPRSYLINFLSKNPVLFSHRVSLLIVYIFLSYHPHITMSTPVGITVPKMLRMLLQCTNPSSRLIITNSYHRHLELTLHRIPLPSQRSSIKTESRP
jgi:hypothetical protein